MEVNLQFLLCLTLYLWAIFQVGGAYIWSGDLTEGFLRYRVGGLIFGGAYTWKGLFSEFYGSYYYKLLIIIINSLWSRALSFYGADWSLFHELRAVIRLVDYLMDSDLLSM